MATRLEEQWAAEATTSPLTSGRPQPEPSIVRRTGRRIRASGEMPNALPTIAVRRAADVDKERRTMTWKNLIAALARPNLTAETLIDKWMTGGRR